LSFAFFWLFPNLQYLISTPVKDLSFRFSGIQVFRCSGNTNYSTGVDIILEYRKKKKALTGGYGSTPAIEKSARTDGLNSFFARSTERAELRSATANSGKSGTAPKTPLSYTKSQILAVTFFTPAV
jgi:hypothetical protein